MGKKKRQPKQFLKTEHEEDEEREQDFIITQNKENVQDGISPQNDARETGCGIKETKNYCQATKREKAQQEKEIDEFDLSDIRATPKEQSPEDIIAASMAEAYKE